MPYRYVAIGDSITEGVGDPDPDGLRGWARRLAAHLRVEHPDLEFENLAARGRVTAQVLRSQLPVAQSRHPDLVTATFGMNDLIRGRVDLERFRADSESIVRGFPDATVVVCTLPDMSRVLPWARRLHQRLATMNQVTREVAQACDAVVLDSEADPDTTDAALWSPDRLHLNAQGHQLFADRVAVMLGVNVPHDQIALAQRPVSDGRLRQELLWVRQHLAPWLGRRVRRRLVQGKIT